MVRLGCDLFNVIIKDIIECINMKRTHSPVMNGLRNPGLLFLDDLAVALFTGYGLQNKIELVDKYCKM